MDEFGRSEIFYAIVNNDLGSFEKELKRVEDINVVDVNGMSLLFFACVYNRLEMAEKLIEHGIAIDIKDNHGNTPLWRATFECKGSHYDLVQLLVSNGADVNSTNNANRSPIMFAETVGDEKLISILKQ